MQKIMELHIAGQIPKDGFAKFYDPLDMQAKQIEKNISPLQGEIDFLKMECQNSDQIVQDAQHLYATWDRLDRETKRNVVEQITSRITMSKDSIHFKFSHNPAFLGNHPDSPRNPAPAATSTIRKKNAPAHL